MNCRASGVQLCILAVCWRAQAPGYPVLSRRRRPEFKRAACTIHRMSDRPKLLFFLLVRLQPRFNKLHQPHINVSRLKNGLYSFRASMLKDSYRSDCENGMGVAGITTDS